MSISSVSAMPELMERIEQIRRRLTEHVELLGKEEEEMPVEGRQAERELKIRELRRHIGDLIDQAQDLAALKPPIEALHRAAERALEILKKTKIPRT